MIKLEAEMTPHDIGQWVRDGWFFFKASPKHRMRIAHLMHVKEGPSDPYIVRDIDGEDFKVKKLPENHIFPHWPTLGSFNISETKCSVYVKRIQSKQWKRTFNYRQLKMLIPRKWEIQKMCPGMGRLSTSSEFIVKAAFEPEYPASMAKVRTMFANGWGSVALSRRIIVTNTFPRLVYYRGKLAAKLEGTGYDVIDPRLTARIVKAYPGGISL